MIFIGLKNIALSMLVVTTVFMTGGGVVAAQTTNAPTPAARPEQIDFSPLPKATTGPNKVQAILTIVFSIIGALSLLMITIGGFRYILSEGDPQASSKAKGTIIYALVGLVVSMTSVAIVTFVLGRV